MGDLSKGELLIRMAQINQGFTQVSTASFLFMLLRPNWESMTDNKELSATHIHGTGSVHSRAQPVIHAERRELSKQTLQGGKGSFSFGTGGVEH